MPLLTARSLSAGYRDGPGVRQVLADVDLELPVNKIVGLAGESGCGKSTLALLLAGYRSPGVRVLGGSVTFRDSELTALGPRKLRRWWGRHIAYLPQDTATALNPALRVGAAAGRGYRIALPSASQGSPGGRHRNVSKSWYPGSGAGDAPLSA